MEEWGLCRSVPCGQRAEPFVPTLPAKVLERSPELAEGRSEETVARYPKPQGALWEQAGAFSILGGWEDWQWLASRLGNQCELFKIVANLRVSRVVSMGMMYSMEAG